MNTVVLVEFCPVELGQYGSNVTLADIYLYFARFSVIIYHDFFTAFIKCVFLNV